MLLQYCNLILPFINPSNGYLQNQSSATRKAAMIRLSYASTAIKEFSPENPLARLKTCRTNNGAKNITGLDLCARHFFPGIWLVPKKTSGERIGQHTYAIQHLLGTVSIRIHDRRTGLI